VKTELRRRLHQPVPEQGAYMRVVVLGHNRYYGVPLNGPALRAFREAMAQLSWHVLRRRSQGNDLTWRRMGAYVARWLPTPRILLLLLRLFLPSSVLMAMVWRVRRWRPPRRAASPCESSRFVTVRYDRAGGAARQGRRIG
jgi:hypothetical protein